MLIVKGYLSDLYDLKYIILVIIMRGKKGKKMLKWNRLFFINLMNIKCK